MVTEQELNERLTNQTSEGQRLLAAREADEAQLQQELLAIQQAERSMPSMHTMHYKHGQLQKSDWQMCISEAAGSCREEEPSDAALKALLEDKRKLQVIPCVPHGRDSRPIPAAVSALEAIGRQPYCGLCHAPLTGMDRAGSVRGRGDGEDALGRCAGHAAR